MATPRDVQEIVTRLSSSKAKAREEGVKLLGSWLEGERSFSFCRLLGQSTSRLRPDEIPHAETWPFLITLLTKCIASEKVASKKSQPKLVWAKTLRTAIQHAEDPKFSGKTLLLLSVVKHLFNHIWDVIKDVPNFQSEYGIILRHLLSVKEYRYHMRTRIYCSLALQYMKRIQTSLSGKNEIHSNAREEVFRCILTLHNLLENPPGDFPDNIREDIVKSFIEIFSLVREEGKISRKLMECVNTYLLKDGPNLGSKAMEIHSCLHDFIFRYWLTTHDQGLKNTFILYAKMQLKLTRRTEGGPLIEELLDVIGKELDQGCAVGSVGMSWSEATRDDKVGPSISSQQSLMELAASVLYQACVNTLKASGTGKRLKRQDALDRLRDGLMKGKWLWCGAFCFLIHNYGFRIEESSITYWFKGISESFERILNDSYSIHSYDGVLWILRGLQELCFVLSHSVSKKYSSPTSDEVRGGWNVIWSCLMHGLPIFSNMPPVVEENIFLEANYLIKSILVWLDALNIVRCHHVAEKALTSPVPSKHSRSSSLSRTRTPEKYKDSLTSPSLDVLSSSTWKKVYWLSIDYLVVAKAAIHCGSYFTAVMYVEYWCEENFHSLTLGRPDFSNYEALPPHIELLVSAVTRINEPDSIYGIIQTCKVSSQIITHEHEGNWSKALEYYDLLIRKEAIGQAGGFSSGSYTGFSQGISNASSSMEVKEPGVWKLHKGLMRSLQQIGCSHVLNVYLEGLADQRGHFHHDRDFAELQYEAAWRAGNWDFSLFPVEDTSCLGHHVKNGHFNENLHSCLRALQEGDCDEFHGKLTNAKEELVISISNASKESTEYINSAIVKLQMLDHLSMAWNLRWKPFLQQCKKQNAGFNMSFSEPVSPTISQLECMNGDWRLIVKQTQLHLNLLEPFIAFRHILLQILRCKESTAAHLLESASVLRKGSKLSLAAAAMHEFKLLCGEAEKPAISYMWSLGRLEEAKILRAQGQHEMAINLARYILENYELAEEASNVYRLIGKWLAETRSSSSRTILEQYLKYSVELAELNKNLDNKSVSRQCKTYFHLAHYTDALFKSYEERLTSSEWQAALRLRKHKTRELDALIRRLKSSAKAEKTDYSAKIQELQKQLTMDREEAEKLQDDRDNFLGLALEGYQHCLILGGKYDMRVVFRLVSLWFCFPSRQNVLRSMLNAVKEVQSHKFIPLVYQIASRMGNPKDGQGSLNFQAVLVSLVKKMAIDHPYHTIFQLLALANGDRVKDKQRSRNSFIVDMDKKLAAENLLNELTSYHGAIIRQMKQMVDIYIKLAELETKKEETNRRIPLPREIRSVRHLELVPVVTATFPVDPSCQYGEGSFPHFKGLGDSIIVMNGINAPKVVECLGSDGQKYRQLAKSGNDDLRQDAVMEQFFGLVNTFLQGNRDTWKRRLRIRTYKVVPFTPSAGVLEWVDQTVPLGEYLIGSLRNGGAHGRYGIGDWSFIQCREHMTNEKDKRKAFQKVSENFRPVMHYFFLERFLQPADWFEKRLSYTRSVATSSMVGYIVGLGDRHSMNILIDQASAEVVHIDLGVAFEQGLMLKTPERVPFRLTRDIVDGMGVTGVEGVFRRCSEETLAVMRTNKEALLTIIEVFIHDPLYKWALSPLKALQRQKETDEDAELSMEDSQDACEGNKDAARALFRVKQKLDGYEDGEMRSVQGQVQQLIQDAIDTERLCLMFPGWGPWL